MKKSINFECALQNLEKIVDRLEQGEETLEGSVELYREGAELIGACKTILNDVENKITLINEENQLRDDI